MILITAAACTTHDAPKVHTRRSADGTRVNYAGVALTVPANWKVRNAPPPACFGISGDTAYFYVNDTDPNAPGLGCPSGGATGPYLIVECHPQVPPPPGPSIRVGPFAALASTHTAPAARREDRAIFLRGRDTMVEMDGSHRLVAQIEATVGQAAGSC